MLQELDEASSATGLKMSMKKTKVMTAAATIQTTVRVKGVEIEQVQKYIGQRFSRRDKNQDAEIRRRIKAG